MVLRLVAHMKSARLGEVGLTVELLVSESYRNRPKWPAQFRRQRAVGGKGSHRGLSRGDCGSEHTDVSPVKSSLH